MTESRLGRLADTVFRAPAELAALGPTKLGPSARYLTAVALTGLATMVRLSFAPQEAGLPYVTYFPAATLAAILGGLGPGLFATALGAGVATYLFIPPFGSVKLGSEAVASALVFCADELIVCTAIEAMRRYYHRHAEAIASLRQAHAAERQARMAAEQADRAKSRFLAAASHDLRQPYQALRLFLATLQSKNLTPERVEAVTLNMDVAMSAGEELLQSLLDISTLEAGVVVPKPVDFEVVDFVRTIEARHRSVAEQKGLRFRVSAHRGMARTDAVLLARIMDNLVANAIRYTKAGGILVACRRHGDGRAFEVWDTGIGIPAEHRDAIFEEFYQVANTERDRARGVGLGLAVVAKTAKLLGLDLSFTSRPGRGTRFRIVVPQDA